MYESFDNTRSFALMRGILGGALSQERFNRIVNENETVVCKTISVNTRAGTKNKSILPKTLHSVVSCKGSVLTSTRRLRSLLLTGGLNVAASIPMISRSDYNKNMPTPTVRCKNMFAGVRGLCIQDLDFRTGIMYVFRNRPSVCVKPFVMGGLGWYVLSSQTIPSCDTAVLHDMRGFSGTLHYSHYLGFNGWNVYLGGGTAAAYGNQSKIGRLAYKVFSGSSEVPNVGVVLFRVMIGPCVFADSCNYRYDYKDSSMFRLRIQHIADHGGHKLSSGIYVDVSPSGPKPKGRTSEVTSYRVDMLYSRALARDSWFKAKARAESPFSTSSIPVDVKGSITLYNLPYISKFVDKLHLYHTARFPVDDFKDFAVDTFDGTPPEDLKAAAKAKYRMGTTIIHSFCFEATKCFPVSRIGGILNIRGGLRCSVTPDSNGNRATALSLRFKVNLRSDAPVKFSRKR